MQIRRRMEKDPDMKKTRKYRQLAALITLPLIAFGTMGFWGSGDKKGINPQDVTDMLHTVMASDRTVYTKMVVNRLMIEEKVIKASEHFKDDKALPLPAQMFRFGAEMAAEKSAKFSYSLQSLWPINKQNGPRTDIEKTGLAFVAENKGKNYYGEEELGGKKYFTAVYADVAVADACVSCHNQHKDTPKNDFKLGDVMGAVVIRLPLAE
jgi:hypothetical protein